MQVSIQQLRRETAQIVSAVERGETVVLTVRGRPVADIVPRRSTRRSTERLLEDLGEIRELAAKLGVGSRSDDFGVGLTTDDIIA